MRLHITGPGFTACRQLMEALEAKGLHAVVGQAGQAVDVSNEDVRQIVLAPPELPYDFPVPKTDYIHVNSERELVAQVAAVIEELEWTV